MDKFRLMLLRTREGTRIEICSSLNHPGNARSDCEVCNPKPDLRDGARKVTAENCSSGRHEISMLPAYGRSETEEELATSRCRLPESKNQQG